MVWWYSVVVVRGGTVGWWYSDVMVHGDAVIQSGGGAWWYSVVVVWWCGGREIIHCYTFTQCPLSYNIC